MENFLIFTLTLPVYYSFMAVSLKNDSTFLFFIYQLTNKRNVVSPFISCLPILFSLRMLFDSLPSKILPFPFCLYFYAHSHIKRRKHKQFIRIFFYQRRRKTLVDHFIVLSNEVLVIKRYER